MQVMITYDAHTNTFHHKNGPEKKKILVRLFGSLMSVLNRFQVLQWDEERDRKKKYRVYVLCPTGQLTHSATADTV